MSQVFSFIAGGLFGGVYMWWRMRRDLVRLVREQLQSSPTHEDDDEGMGTRGEWRM